MAITMVPKHHLLLLTLLFTTLSTKALPNVSIKTSLMYPLTCSDTPIKTCTSSLYHISNDLTIQEISTLYSVNNTALITPIDHGAEQDYLVSAPCECKDIDGRIMYIHETVYRARAGDTFDNITRLFYSGQAWKVRREDNITEGDEVLIHLLCGCLNDPSKVVVTYTVQAHDTLSAISASLNSSLDGIEHLNGRLTQSPGFIDVDWVLFVPSDKVQSGGESHAHDESGIKKKTALIASVSASIVAVSVIGAAIVFFLRREKPRQINVENPITVNKCLSAKKPSSLQQKHLHVDNMECVAGFESERPVIFTVEEVEAATRNCDETRKIGEGGYGSVYFGVLADQEVAVKKMKTNKSKEFFAELKVLCRIHHINVVELIGYASGDDYLYLVYEYVQNGSLSDHLHDPLLKGHQPLSWNARAQIAVDAARGIEYIHDHTKARYVHRDIKTSNILLDDGLRAKVADFGLAKLVERTGEDDCIATRLVGTPGYLPPESVRELQMTSKTDVYAFGVVLAELITGQRALIRDNHEPSKMKSLISVVYAIFREEEPESALEAMIDGNLRESYPIEEIYKMAEIAVWCLDEDAVNRPEMQEIVVKLSNILMSSVEWEASLGGNSQVFSGVLSGR